MIPYFEHPEYLFIALACVPAGIFYFFRYRHIEKSLLRFFFRKDSRFGTSLSRSLALKFVFFSLAWIFLSGAAASPRWGTELTASRQEGSSVIFVMDVSRSMTASDILPSRLSFASRYASLLVEKMENVPCGVVLVKGDGVLALPLTLDHHIVLDLFSVLSPSMLTSPGSDIGKGVKKALASFPSNRAASRVIVLLTDGDETKSSLMEAARLVHSEGASLAVVGIGTPSGAEIDISPLLDGSRMQLTKLRSDILNNAVRMAGGDSLYVNGSEAGSALRVLDASVSDQRIGKKTVYSPKPVYRYREFLLMSLFFICAGFFIGGQRWEK